MFKIFYLLLYKASIYRKKLLRVLVGIVYVYITNKRDKFVVKRNFQDAAASTFWSTANASWSHDQIWSTDVFGNVYDFERELFLAEC